ncbi:MAG: phage protein NinX family protein [Aeromonadaceae bacterium]
MNYEKASKFEVNAAVSKYVLWKNRQCEEIDCNDKTGIVSWADGANWHEFNPHDNPSDAWPIIMENKIAVMPWNSQEWQAFIMKDGELTLRVRHSNPLRAAMIVFLMMQEAKRG